MRCGSRLSAVSHRAGSNTESILSGKAYITELLAQTMHHD